MGYTGNNIAAERISQVFSGVQARFDAISSKTGISFGAYLQSASQSAAEETDATASAAAKALLSADDVIAAAIAGGSSSGVVDLLASYYEAAGLKNPVSDTKETADQGGTDEISKATNVTPDNSALLSSEKLPSGAYDDLIAEIAARYGIDPLLIKAVCYAESSYNPNSTSRKGAMGLMQLMPATASGLGVQNGYDPEENMDGGVRYILAQLQQFNGDARKAIAAYNCGPARVEPLGDLTDPAERAKLPAETQQYLTRIESLLLSVGASYIFGEQGAFTPAAVG